MANKKSKKKDESEETSVEEKLSPHIKSIIFFASAILLFALVLLPGENLWTMMHLFFQGLLGILAISCPCILTYLGVMTAFEKEISKKTIHKFILTSLVVLLFSTCIFLFGNERLDIQENYFQCIGRLFTNAQNDLSDGSATGIIGGLLGYPIAYMFGFTASELLCILSVAIILMLLFGVTTKDILIFINKIFNKIKKFIKQIEFEKGEKNNKFINKIYSFIQNKKIKKKKVTVNKSENSYDDNYLVEEISKQVSNVKNKKKNNKSAKPSIDIFDTGSDYIDISSKSDIENKPTKLSKDTERFENTKSKKISKKEELANAEKEISKQIESFREEDDTSGYNYPLVELLHTSESKEDIEKANSEMERNENKLDSTLKSFGVNASIVNVCRGPSVTRFEVKPAPGVKISKITNLSDDIALNLAASGVRIEAPIPGKSAVGIEVPNKVTTMVTMRELIESKEFINSKSKLSVVLGKDISGNTIVADLAKMPHLLIAGTTGSGKSVCVNSILISLLYKANPQEVRMVLIDPKMVEFSKYKGIPHLLIDVVTDPKKAAGALNWAVNEMETRYKDFSIFGVRDIYSYNKMVESYNKIREKKTVEELEENPIVNSDGIPIPEKKMHSIVVAIDEFADLMMTAPNEVEEAICRLAQKARAAGMHLVVATQRPTVNVITGLIKANIPSRIALKVSSQLDSRTIIDTGGAEKLIGRGDMLFAPIGVSKPIRVQGCFASDNEIESVTKYIKKDHILQYDMKVEEEIEKITEQGISKDSNNNESNSSEISTDNMMEDAIKLVLETGQASTSMLQRRLRLGYARAGRLIDEMEQMGIVGPHVGSKSREVLITYQDWLDRKNIISQSNQEDL